MITLRARQLVVAASVQPLGMMETAFHEPEPSVLVVEVCTERLDALAAPAFLEETLRRIESMRRVVVDLSAVEFVDSTGLGALVSVYKRLPSGSDLRLVGVRPRVLSVLQLTHLDRLLPIARSLTDALRVA